jgi:hypothetical protein
MSKTTKVMILSLLDMRMLCSKDNTKQHLSHKKLCKEIKTKFPYKYQNKLICKCMSF